jgi:putative heme-binding domain-containing protein
MRRRVWLMLCMLVGLPLPCVAQGANPFENDAAAIGAGASLYASRCADCHGADAKGNRGPDLTQRWAAGATDESVFEKIRSGVAGSIMPPSSAPDDELWAIVAYLRDLSVMPPLATTGNPARGAEVFARECAACHRVGDRGGALGPNLSTIGQQRSRAALVAAIREPSATVARGYRTAVWSAAGREHTGVIKSEDAFSIQIMTADGRLQGFDKASLPSLERRSESLMPAYTPAELGDAELENLLAYLGTLRNDGARKP